VSGTRWNAIMHEEALGGLARARLLLAGTAAE
jgi:hypothetical protein